MMEAQTKLSPESAVEQLTSQANTTVYAQTKPCPKCGLEKTVFRGGSCFACWGDSVGERIQWVNCGECGETWSKLMESGICPKCSEKKVEQTQKSINILRRLKKLFGSEKSINELTLDNFTPFDEDEGVYIAAKNFNPEKDNFYFFGKTGRGKTHLAYAIAQKFLREGKSVEILTQRGLVNRFRMIKPDQEIEESEFLTNVDVLVIDDMGIMKSTEFALDILLDVISKRTLKDKCGLIVTSNLYLDELAKKNEDDRISSRLAGICKIFHFKSQYDFRTERRG